MQIGLLQNYSLLFWAGWFLVQIQCFFVLLFVCYINIVAEKAQDPEESPRGCKEPLQRESKKQDINMQQHLVRHTLIFVPDEPYAALPSQIA